MHSRTPNLKLRKLHLHNTSTCKTGHNSTLYILARLHFSAEELLLYPRPASASANVKVLEF